MAGQSDGPSVDRTVLPPPDPSFEGEIIFTTDDTFDVGEDWGTPVSPTYEPPFTFTGILKSVTVEAKGS
jgi:hypothetical protein